jgi:F1F0 ATPase subunit 2
MNDAVMLFGAALGAALVGMLLGAFFFGGLWWTVRRGAASAQPAVWFFGSLVVRTAVVLGGFYAIADGQWQRLLLCGLGFIAARLVSVRLVGSATDAARGATQEAGGAP